MPAVLSGDSVLPDIPVAFLLSVHSPVLGSYFTLHLITYVLTLLGKEKQSDEDYNMFPLSNLLPPLHLNPSVISFQLWWIASLILSKGPLPCTLTPIPFCLCKDVDYRIIYFFWMYNFLLYYIFPTKIHVFWFPYSPSGATPFLCSPQRRCLHH